MIQWPSIDLDWSPAYRIIPTRFPSINLFDRVAAAEDFEALYELEAMTNPRIRNEIGELALVPSGERLYGPGCGSIMAAFTHLNPNGSRFSDGSYGVFYAAQEKDTAIAETKHHSAAFMRATKEAPTYLQMRLLQVKIRGPVSDLNAAKKSHPELLSAHSYAAPQALGKQLRAGGANGICYPSVRHTSGLCVAAFRTSILRNCQHAAHLEYHWDGAAINYVTERIE